MIDATDLAAVYTQIRDRVIQAGYWEEMEWVRTRDFRNVDCKEFMRRYTFVVLVSGFNERVVTSKIGKLSDLFHNFQDLEFIVNHWDPPKVLGGDRTNSLSLLDEALRIFGNRNKINCVVVIARRILEIGWSAFREQMLLGGMSFLRTLPYIGGVTVYHLARNLGIADVAKPDLHLTRIAFKVGRDVQELCRVISEKTGDKISVVDSVLWRFATLNRNYLDMFPKN